MNLNAKQKDQLLENILKLVQKSSGGPMGSMTRKASGVTEVGTINDGKKEELFNFLFTGPNGLKRVAYAMQGPLKELLDYHGLGRRLLKVDPIPQGEFPIYDKDIAEFASVRVANQGVPPQVETRVKRIQFPTMQLAKSARVAYEDIQIRRYPVFDRAKERIAISMAIAEDREIFNLLNVAAEVGPNEIVDLPAVAPRPAGFLSREAIADAYAKLASNQLQPAQLVMHPLKYADILKYNQTDIDQVTLNATTETGSIGVFMGLQLLVSTKLPETGSVFMTTTPDKLGRIPLRKELEVKIFDNAPKISFNVVGWELIGFGIHNSYGVVKMADV
jgi:hypothetical protein